jgi:hypothetical protein
MSAATVPLTWKRTAARRDKYGWVLKVNASTEPRQAIWRKAATLSSHRLAREASSRPALSARFVGEQRIATGQLLAGRYRIVAALNASDSGQSAR